MDDIAELRADAATHPMHGVWAKGGPVFSHLSEETIEGIEGRTIASFGDAATLGLWAYATGIWITGVFQSGILPTSEMQLLFPLLLVYSGIVQFIAGLFLYRRNNTFLGATCSSYGAVNLTRGALLCCQAAGVLPTDAAASMLEGCMLAGFTYIALSLLIGSMAMNRVLVGLFGFTFVGYLLSSVAYFANQTTSGGYAEAGHIGGYLLIVAGAIAYYGGSALLVNTALRRVVLPIGGQA